MINIITLLKNAINKVITLDADLMDAESLKTFFSAKNYPVTYEMGSGWTMNSCNVYAFGSIMRISMNITRSSATGAGAIENETVATLTIEHGGQIGSATGNTAINMSGGPIASFHTDSISVNETTMSVRIRLNNTHSAATAFNTSICMPICARASAY